MGKRYINDITLSIDPAYIENTVQAYLNANNFKSVCEKGEYFYKAGGIITSLRGFKYWYVNGILHIEAWIGKVGKEMNIGDGKLLGAASKIPYYNSILALLDAFDKERQSQHPNNQILQPNVQMQQPYPLMQQNGQQQYAQQPYPQMQQNGQQQYTQQPYPQMQQVNSTLTNEINRTNDKNASIAFWLSIASLILIFGSRFSLVLNLFSYKLAISNGLKSRKKGMAIAAIVINSIVIVITLILFLK